MGRVLTEQFNIIGETRAIEETSRRTKNGIVYAHSMINWEIGSEGTTLVRSKGFKKIFSIGNKKVQNMIFTQDNSGNLRWTIASGGNLYEVDKEDNAFLNSAIRKVQGLADGYIDLIEAGLDAENNFIVVLDGDYPKKYDHEELTNLTTNHKCSIGKYINDRLWTNDMDEKALIRWSSASDISDFTATDDAGFLQIESNSKPITAISDVYVAGNNTTNVAIAKEDELHAISGSNGISTDANRFKQFNLSRSIGTLSPRGLTKVEGDVFILGKSNILNYTSSTTDNGVLKASDIFEQVRPLYQSEINQDYINDGFIFYDKHSLAGKVYCFVPTNGLNWNDTAYTFDRRGGWFRRKWYTHQFTCMVTNPETKKVYAGDKYGNIYEMFTGYSYDGGGYNCLLDLGFVDFGAPFKTKTGRDTSFIEVESSASANFTIGILKKEANGLVGKINQKDYSINPYQSLYNSAIYNTSAYDTNFPQKFRIKAGIFESLDVQVSTTEPNSDLKINSIILQAESQG